MRIVENVFKATKSSGLLLRPLQRSDFEATMKIHRAVIASLPSKELFRDLEDSTLFELLGEGAACFGIFDNNEMVAYTSMRYPSSGRQGFSHMIGFPETAVDIISEFDGSAVLPSYRGKGFQSVFIKVRARASLLRGRPITMALVSPSNQYSVNNVVQYGMTGRSLVSWYGDLKRILFARDHSAEVSRRWTNVEECSADDVDRLGNLLASGMELFKVISTHEGTGYLLGYRDNAKNSHIFRSLGVLFECGDV